jgi:hypothetical protein
LNGVLWIELDLPEGEEILDLLLAGGGADVFDVNGVGRHDGGEGIEVWCDSVCRMVVK